jgi:hypothetical protein
MEWMKYRPKGRPISEPDMEGRTEKIKLVRDQVGILVSIVVTNISVGAMAL